MCISAGIRIAYQRAPVSGARLGEANLSGANLRDANLTETNFSGTNFTNSQLDTASLVETRMNRAILLHCTVYGISAWKVDLVGARQINVIISKADEPAITADSLEVAQVLYLRLHNAKIRHVIDTLTS
jgi:uncharacterized protein YjbI with pentapeptide repeats